MPTVPPPAPISRGALWAGRAMSGFAILFLAFDGAIKLVPIGPITETLTQLGYAASPGLARGLGGLTLACTLLYAWPRTAPLGAVLLTGYLGGAIATHLRAGSPVFSHLLFGLYLGLLVWGGLALRDARLRALLRPGRSSGGSWGSGATRGSRQP